MRLEETREFEHAGDARCVIVSAVMYLAFTRRQTAFTAATEMIVVRANDDRFVFQLRIATRQDADDVV